MYDRSGDAPMRETHLTMTPDLLRLLTSARIGDPGALDQLLARAEASIASVDQSEGTDLLIFLCGSTPSAAPISALRAVLPTLPRFAPLPASPPWLLGVFPFQGDVLGLVDPAPLLLGMGTNETYSPVLAPRRHASSSFFPAPPTGPLGLTHGTGRRRWRACARLGRQRDRRPGAGV